MVGERDRTRIGLETHFQTALRPDRNDPRRAEPVWAALARERSPGAGDERDQRDSDPH